ncbi:Probable aspartic proteinase GIP2 [Linum perenne]
MSLKNNNHGHGLPIPCITTLVFTTLLFSPCKTHQSLYLTLNNPTTIHLPVWKDSNTLQYVTQIKQRTPSVAVNLTLHIGGRHLWVDCDQPYISSTYSPAPCNSPHCSLIANSNSCFNDCFFGPPQPGCYNNTCGLVADNSVAGVVAGGQGRHPGFLFTCGTSFLLEGLADNVSGMAGLGRTEMSVTSQFSSAFSTDRTFTLCLGPTSGAVVFSSTIIMTNSALLESLVFTPLLTNPVSTATAYSDVKVNGTPVKVNSTLLSIDGQGYGGTKISTVHPYTVLESSIYDAVSSAFVDQAARARYNLRRVVWAGPFGVRMTRMGPIVPIIEMEFENNIVSWRMFGTNSMVRVGQDVVCLGLVDGGLNPKTSIVIGGHQLEDNLVVFDVDRKRVGFGSSLLGQGKSCDKFLEEIAKEVLISRGSI